jgi:hypothetical protein
MMANKNLGRDPDLIDLPISDNDLYLQITIQ